MPSRSLDYFFGAGMSPGEAAAAAAQPRNALVGAGMSPGEAAAATRAIGRTRSGAMSPAEAAYREQMQQHAAILAAAQQQARQEFDDRFTGGGQLPGRPPMYRQQWQPLNDLLQRYGFMSRGEGQIAYPGLERGDFPQAMRP